MKNLYFLIYFFLFTRIVYGQSNEFVTEFHDLNDNQIPNGWVFDTNGSPGGDISNGRINSYIVDGGAHLSKTASVSNITQEIILEMDTYVTYSYWGMVPNFQIYNGDKILSFRSGVERYDHPDNTIVYTLTYYDGITTTYEFDNSAPRVDGIYHLKLIMNDNGYRFIGTDPSDVEAFNIFVEDTNYFDFRQIDKISYSLSTHTDNDSWIDNLSITVNESTPSCVNTVYPVTLGGGEPGGVAVQSVTLTPSNPGPNETVQAEITWAFSGNTNIVKGNVYGDWDTASELGQIYNGIDGSQTVTQTVSFTAPGTAGSHSLRFIWAYDIGDFADYDSGNLPTESQCSTWGNSKSIVYDHAFNVETACVNTVYPVTLDGGEPGGVAVQSVTLTPSNPGPNETVQAEITWVFSGDGNIVKANVYGDWDTASELGQTFNSIDNNQTVTQTVSFTAPGTAGSYNLRFIWAYDIGDFADYDSGNLPTESQCSTWGNSKSVVYDHAFNVETATTNVDYLIVEDGNAFIGNTNNINVILTNTEIIKGFQFDITFPDGFVFDPADITNIGLPENYQISSADIGSNSFRVVGFSLTNETIAAGSTSIISFPTYINDGTATGDYPIPITNVTLSDINNVDVSTPSPGDGIITVYSHPMGDANGDDAIDILDILNVIDYIFGNPPANFNIDLADVNGDGTINVLDILEIQDIILSPSTSANLSNGKSSSEKQQLSGNNYLIITDDTFSTSTSETMEINLSNDDVIKGLQFDFTLPSGFTLNSADIPGAATSRLDGFTISAQEVSQNTFRVIIFSLTSATVSPGNTPIFNLPEFIESSVSNGVYPISFTNVTLSDTNNSDISTVAPSTGQITVGTLGLIDFENNRNTFILYPNPTKEVINIKGNLSKLETVDFYSITGEHVMQIHDNFGKINIESLQSGLYFIKLTGEMTTEFKKIIKN